jgi:hypothetical protein
MTVVVVVQVVVLISTALSPETGLLKQMVALLLSTPTPCSGEQVEVAAFILMAL